MPAESLRQDGGAPLHSFRPAAVHGDKFYSHRLKTHMHRSIRDGVGHLSYADRRFSYLCRRASYGHRSFSYDCRDRFYTVKLPGKPVSDEKGPFPSETAPFYA